MNKKLLLIFLLAALTVSLTACQAFLEDYSYSPAGNLGGNSYNDSY